MVLVRGATRKAKRWRQQKEKTRWSVLNMDTKPRSSRVVEKDFLFNKLCLSSDLNAYPLRQNILWKQWLVEKSCILRQSHHHIKILQGLTRSSLHKIINLQQGFETLASDSRIINNLSYQKYEGILKHEQRKFKHTTDTIIARPGIRSGKTFRRQ